ncbi:MAG: acyl transferase [Bacteroidetes bacterium MedPE-SWsnd-G2]|nr:MAG: acyl transferase [Bacteroidetes bacterium MedPE-SWsnd-G2]
MVIPENIFEIQTEVELEAKALEVFNYQFQTNKVYRSFCDLLYKHPSDVKQIKDIPFIPIQFFKSHEVYNQKETPEIIFSSSGTTGSVTSKHYVTDLAVYEKSYNKGFTEFYGNIEDYAVLALLPSYLERSGSSLIYMAEDLIKKSNHKDSGFYLNNLDALIETINKLEQQGQKTLLLGVSFALLDLIEKQQFNLKHTTVMETGGMKGKRKELIRAELHDILRKGFGVKHIHSEYGMTELLSQGYSKGDGVFECPPWMKILTRDPEDALSIQQFGKSGGINIIDLANINSCAFIATQDLGKVYRDGSFEVLGRFDNSDIRGCNLMVF